MTVSPGSAYDGAYRSQRLRLAATVSAAAARLLAYLSGDQAAAIAAIVPVVEAGQRHTVSLVDAYMAAKTLQATGAGTVIGLDPALYTISELRNGVAADIVYQRAFNTLISPDATDVGVARAFNALDKLVRTDLQLTQTHAARDWMTQDTLTATSELRIVGYRRVLTGPGPHCALCEAASTRTYRVSDLMPIHEHCGCTVEPIYGTQPVASTGTTVRVENDPEIGPRLMADNWSDVGPRLTA